MSPILKEKITDATNQTLLAGLLQKISTKSSWGSNELRHIILDLIADGEIKN